MTIKLQASFINMLQFKKYLNINLSFSKFKFTGLKKKIQHRKNNPNKTCFSVFSGLLFLEVIKNNKHKVDSEVKYLEIML